MEAVLPNNLTPERAKAVLSEHLLTEGMMPLMLDMKSRGLKLRDEATGRTFLDFFGFYASSAIGMNHPKTNDEAFRERLMEAALNKITNSDVQTRLMARFVETFSRVAIPDELPHAFFISGGALAIENALKTAFDWKVRKNFEKGYRREVGSKVLHLDEAFHGRTGYTMSLTNTADPRKTQYFPQFDWPRITNPKALFPLQEHEAEVAAHEKRALRQARRCFQEQGDEIAAIILEPIQGEGGDNHFRPEFLQQLRTLANEEDALLIFDEVQSGAGITGNFWAYQSLGVRPDILAFGKKTQVCGMLASRRIDEVDGHVFETQSRLNSTWGGNLADMVRFDRTLEIIEEDELVPQAGRVGAHLLERLRALEADREAVTQTRGRGLMCAFDLPSAAFRDSVLRTCYEEGVILLGCGERSVRFRPPLTITESQIDEGLAMLERAVEGVQRNEG